FRERFNLVLNTPVFVTDFTHQTTHRTIHFVVMRSSVRSGRLRPNAGVWRALDRLDDLPMSNPQRETLTRLQNKS
ncbi:MAG: hypothetical protein ACPGYV_12310, partial [Phycisphaeraceae bacterium]